MDDDSPTSVVNRLLFGSALDLSAKAYAQPIGVEDSWEDLGDGVVEISAANTLRVVRYGTDSRSSSSDENKKGADSSDSANNSSSNGGKNKKKKGKSNDALDVATIGGSGSSEPDVLIEDHISEEIPLVGKDCCIVWNSPTHDMSFCIMFSSECGYAAVWSAVHLLQGKSDIPPLGWDYLSSFRSMEQRSKQQGNGKDKDDDAAASDDAAGKKKKKKAAANGSGGKLEPERSAPVAVDAEGDDSGAAAAGAKAAGGAAGGGDMDDPLTSSLRQSQREEAVNEASVDAGSRLAASTSGDSNANDEAGGAPADEKIAEAFAEAVRQVSSMSFIHRHCVAQSYIEGRCAVTTGWGMKNAHVVQVLFSLFHPGLIFSCVDDDGVFAKLVAVVSSDAASAQEHVQKAAAATNATSTAAAAASSSSSAKKPQVSRTLLKRWNAPKMLPDVTHSLDVARSLNRSMRLSLLRHEMVIPGTEEGVLTFLETLQQQELHSVLAAVTDHETFVTDLVAAIGDAESGAPRLEAALRCIGDIVQNAVTLLPREMMLPMIARIDDAGLVPALEKLCARLLLVSAPSPSPAPVTDAAPASALYGDAALKVMDALGALFEAAIVTMNVRAEEGIVGGLWRKPLMEYGQQQQGPAPAAAAAADKKGGKASSSGSSGTTEPVSNVLKVLAFWNRLVLANGGSPTPVVAAASSASAATAPSKPSALGKRTSTTGAAASAATAAAGASAAASKSSDYFQQQRFTSGLQRGGTFFLYNLCGLHDDEGHTVDRSSDASAVEARSAFRLHFASTVLPLMVQAPAALFPPPKALGSSFVGSAPGGASAGGGATASALSKPPVITSSELTFLECFMNLANAITLKKTLQVLVQPPSILPSLLATVPQSMMPGGSPATLTRTSSSSFVGAIPPSSSAAPTATTAAAAAAAHLPAHVLCARARMIRAILSGIATLELMSESLFAQERELESKKKSGAAAAASDRRKSESGSSNFSVASQFADDKKKDGAAATTAIAAASVPGADDKKDAAALQQLLSGLIYRITFDNDVMGPVLAAYAAIQRRTTASVMRSLYGLPPKLSPSPSTSSLGKNDAAPEADKKKGGTSSIKSPTAPTTPATAQQEPPVQLHRAPMLVSAMNTVFSTLRNPAALLPLRRFLRIRHGQELPEELRRQIEYEEEQMLRDELVPMDSSTLSLQSTSAGGMLGMGHGASSHLKMASGSVSGLAPSRNSSSSSGRVSPSSMSPEHGAAASPGRRTLVVDAEIPPPRSPEQLPLKRRSPSPPNPEGLTPPPMAAVGAAAAAPFHGTGPLPALSSGNNNVARQLVPMGVSRPSGGASSLWLEQQQLQNAAAASSANSVIAADMSSTASSAVNGMPFRPVAPKKPTSGNQQNVAPRANSGGRPNSRGGSSSGSGSVSSNGRPRSGGPGQRSRSPISNLVRM